MAYVSSERTGRCGRRTAIGAFAVAATLALLVANFTIAQDSSPRSFAGPPSFADVVDEVSPAVVNISVKQSSRSVPTSGLRREPGANSPLDEFFGRFFGGPGIPDFRGMPSLEREVLGTGFVVDVEGYIATNRHVVENASDVQVTLQSGERLPATVVGEDPQTDLALLKIEAPRGLPALEFGDSDRVRIGEWVLAIGNPFGLGGTATAGIISARGRDIRSGPYDDYLQIDAPINQGNSGGPIFNAAGEVIGINTAIVTPNGGNVGIAFAIPANQAKTILTDLKESGAVSRGWLGVDIQDLDEGLVEALGLPGTGGALIAGVQGDSPAARGGLEPGDVVTAFAGKTVDSPKTLARLVGEQKAGSRAEVTVWREGRARELTVELGEREKPARIARSAPAGTDAGSALGLRLQDLSQEHRRRLGLDSDAQGAIVTAVEPGSAAARQGLEPGDVIVQVNQKNVDSASDVLDELAAARDEGRRALVLLRRGDAQRFVALDFA